MLHSNPLSSTSLYTYIPQLLARGVTVTPYLPVAVAGGPYQVEVNTCLELDGSDSYHSDPTHHDEIVSYIWDFGDGHTASGLTSSHTYATAGSYLVTCYVTDCDGDTGTCQATVEGRTEKSTPATRRLAVAPRRMTG